MESFAKLYLIVIFMLCSYSQETSQHGRHACRHTKRLRRTYTFSYFQKYEIVSKYYDENSTGYLNAPFDLYPSTIRKWQEQIVQDKENQRVDLYWKARSVVSRRKKSFSASRPALINDQFSEQFEYSFRAYEDHLFPSSVTLSAALRIAQVSVL